jgi:integrase
VAGRGEEAGALMRRRTSTIVARARKYLAHRRALGFELESTGNILLDFARFADSIGQEAPLTTELMLRWATSSKDHSIRYRAARLSAVRGFARHLAAEDGRGEVPDMRLLTSGFRREQPHIYTDRQLHQLLAAAAHLSPAYPLRPHTYATFFGLLASTGVRVSEAIALQRDDVDLRTGVLVIKETKFRKSRLVPMHATVVHALHQYAARCDRDPDARSSRSFFVGARGKALSYTTVRHTFRGICRRLGWQSNGTRPRPRIHDLRHSFACRRLLRWYREGVDVDGAIASLSTYLGHGKVTDTYWYLSATTELLALVGERFERFASSRSAP